MLNVFCDSADLHNEADVEALFVEPLLHALSYPDNRVRRKASIETLRIPRGSRTEAYKPDYILLDSAGRPVAIVDAKSPDEQPANFLYQVAGYALLINQRYPDNPVRYCVLSNGIRTELYQWDRGVPELVLHFSDFDPGNAAFAGLRSALSYEAFNQELVVSEVRPGYHRPTISQIVDTFSNAHDLIWKKEKYGPTKAFYELAKLLFVKLRQDRTIHDLIASGGQPTAANFYFTVDWMENQPTPNPVSDMLFHDIQEELEAGIRSGTKKRIFGAGETIDLRRSTVLEVVRLLESFDLHGIDEDLNGRMFEVFLNATVRGKELGQFFTPRPIVKYMTKTARLSISGQTLPRVIDACCGSGGFLIEALAELSYAIKNRSGLTNVEKDRLLSNLQTDCLFGIDANDEIGRVARLNMYLHGDGGSRIYVADSLDKELTQEPGHDHERRQQLEELRNYLLRDGLRFDVALTNPPFSMSYSKKEADERRILDQYQIVPGQSAHSNVLFLERYRDLLTDHGDLLTVIDDTVLNGIQGEAVRQFIRDNFIIRQVVSLPFNAFFKAQANIKTSILHLRRRQPNEEQGDVFMAITNNVGHSDTKHDTPHRDNLPEVANLFFQWDDGGETPSLIRPNEADEPLGCPLQVFVVSAADLNWDRLDAFYYAPELANLRAHLRARAEAGEIRLRPGSEFDLIGRMSTHEREDAKDKAFQYIEITGVTRDGQIVAPMQGTLDDLPTRAEIPLQTGDVLFAKNNSSRGTSVLVPEWLDGGLATSGFISVRPESEEDGLILWTIFRSELWRMQTYYLAITASQPEVRDEIFREEMLIPWPVSDEHRQQIVRSAGGVLAARVTEREASAINRSTLDGMLIASTEPLRMVAESEEPYSTSN